MKKTICFIIGFSLAFILLTLYSTHRVYIEVETNNPQNIQMTNWGKQFEEIKYPEKNKVTFWHRFHTLNDKIVFEIPIDTIEIMSIQSAGKTYTASEIEKAITGKVNIESTQFDKNKNVLKIKQAYRIEKSKGFIFTDIPALTDLQKRFKYAPLLFGLLAGVLTLLIGPPLFAFLSLKFEKCSWINQCLKWIESLTTRDFIYIGTLLLFITFAYLSFSPPLINDNINAHYPTGNTHIIYAFFAQSRLYGVPLLFFSFFDTVPIFFSFLGCVFLFLTAYVYTRIFHCTPLQKLCIYLIILTFPTWSYVWVFFYQCMQTGFFAMLAMISFYYFIRNNNGSNLPKRDFFISLIFFFFACWGFETTTTIFFVLLATWLLTFKLNQINFFQILKQTFLAILIVVSACLSAYLFATIIRLSLGLGKSKFHHIIYQYFSTCVTPSDFISTISVHLLKSMTIFPYDWYGLIWFLLIPLCVIVILFKSKISNLYIHLLVFLGMILIPFLSTFLIGAVTLPRFCLAYPFMVAGVVLILLYHVKTKWLIFLILGICFALMLKSTFYINKRNFYENKQKNFYEYHLHEVVNLINQNNGNECPLAFVGELKNNTMDIGNIPFSNYPLFTLENHYYYGTYFLFFYYNHAQKVYPGKEVSAWAVDVSKTWPSYPNKQCAKIVDSVMIIKLSESTYKDN